MSYLYLIYHINKSVFVNIFTFLFDVCDTLPIVMVVVVVLVVVMNRLFKTRVASLQPG